MIEWSRASFLRAMRLVLIMVPGTWCAHGKIVQITDIAAGRYSMFISSGHISSSLLSPLFFPNNPTV